MTITEAQYFDIRSKLLHSPDHILDLEKYYMDFLLNILMEIVEDIEIDFSKDAQHLLPFWKNYPPEQRGRQPTGSAIPLLELGEKTLSSHLLRGLTSKLSKIRFPGLPSGGDIRFSTLNAYIHFDIKLTGPNDNPDELVVPPNQISGNGSNWENNGVINKAWPVRYQTGTRQGQINYHFQPKLPPFYAINQQILICLTFFLKAIYRVKGLGIQPLSHFELACVPNGLLMFENDYYGRTEGLIIAGKNDKNKSEDSRRIRIRLNPLARLQNWRSIKLLKVSEKWKIRYRADEMKDE